MGTDRESGFARADAHADAGRLEEAIAEYRSALAAQPGDVAAHTRLGLILRSCGDLDGAIESLNTALQLAPDADVARLNLALALDEAGDSSGALAFIEAAGDLIASSPRARWMASRILLRAGDFARGFAMHEARWDAGDASMRMRPYGKPRWRGEPAPGARLLIWHEQGLGDTLLALRHAATVRARGLSVVAHVQAPLAALARAYAGVEAVFDSEPPESAFDLHIPALSLPHALALDVHAAGGGLPALTPPPARMAKWRALLPPARAFRIGLAWRSTVYRDDLLVAQSKLARSLPLAALAPFGALPGVELVSLQVGHGAAETGVPLLDLTAHIDDMADTAALIAGLDLIVSIDTSVAHVAGAMGTPLFVLVNSDPDWRWLAGSVTSPWYPAARIFRQGARNDWRGAVGAAAAAAREMAATRTPPSWLDRVLARTRTRA